jgi:uncharacterized repeat protein (TIGR01451 family)
VGESFLASLTVRNEGTAPERVDEIVVDLPAGVAYVGQAFGSDVANPAEVSSSQLRWTGPFTLSDATALEVRFWAAASKEANPGEHPIQVMVLDEDGAPTSSEWTLVLVPGEEADTPPVQPTEVEKVAAEPSAVEVTKTADSDEVDPGEPVLYTVTFSNSGGPAVTLETITDVLPAGFDYVGVAWDSEIGHEEDPEEPEIVWEGPFVVPAGGSTTLKYWVRVPPGMPVGSGPHTNQVTASDGATSMGPAYADVWVGEMSPPTPQNVEASDGTFTDKVRITWDTVAEATSYKVYRASSPAGAQQVGTATTNLYDDTDASVGITYYYWVTACETSCSTFSEPDTGYRGGYRVFLPAVVRSDKPATTLPFVDTFAQLSPDWMPFATPTGPYADQWVWGPAGYYWYDPEAGGHTWDDFALSMYQGTGATDWSDYQVVTRIRLREDRLGGVWIRGSYQGGQLGGYYVHIQPRDDFVYLWRFPTGATRPDQASIVTKNDYGPKIDIQAWYDLKVVAQGNNIQVWLKSKDEPASAYRSIIDWTDSNSTWMKGTVGFSAYKTFAVYDEITVTAYP